MAEQGFPELSDSDLVELDNLVEDLEIAELVKRRLSSGEPSEPLSELAEKLGFNIEGLYKR